MKLNDIINRVAWDVSEAFGHDADLVKKFKKSLRREFALLPESKKKLVGRINALKSRTVRLNFRARILEKALNLAAVRLMHAKIDHADMFQALRMSARLARRKASPMPGAPARKD